MPEEMMSMDVTIKYLLSAAGRKASILAGGDGKSEQEIIVPFGSPCFKDAIDAATVDYDGRAVIDLTRPDHDLEPCGPICHDTPQSVESLLAAIANRRRARVDAITAASERVRAATLAVVSEHRTHTHTEVCYENPIVTRYEVITPAWPYPCDEEVRNSPKALEWVAALNLINAVNHAAAIEEGRRLTEERDAKVKAEAEAEAARRAALNLRDGEDDYRIEDGALIEVPCWENHNRGKNWMATIAADPKSPGGLARSFAEKAKGDSYYLVPNGLLPGMPIEFGSDYYTGSGRAQRSRWYGYVVSISPERLILHRCKTGKAAISEGTKFLAEQSATA
jgi:hypothetical protein